ncbi:MAG: hypothetical protein IPG25_11780 [Proteobacteria bacterium]|nr:hypothetical protein [Pseudomonadota bacterium]
MLSTAHAATVETLLMPGKVSQPHAKYEEDCSLCHDRTDRSRQTSLCLDCHKETASDIVKQVGLHGRMKNIGATQCKACHSEHPGARPTSSSSIAPPLITPVRTSILKALIVD